MNLLLAALLALLLLVACDRHDDHREPAGSAEHAEGKKHDGDEKHAKKAAAGHDDEEGEEHGEAGDEDEHAGEALVQLSPEQIREFGIEIATAGPGAIDQYAELPGEIVLNADRLAHVVPRVSGIVRQVKSSLGDRVRAGELLAVLESRELADAKAEFLAARERLSLAQATFEREEGLWQKKVSAEQDFLEARQTLAEARIALNTARQKLHALGYSEADLQQIVDRPELASSHYRITAPFAGTVIEKHLTLGENVNADAAIFTIADLATVWLDINVYQKDLARIRKGQPVVVAVGHDIPDVTGEIAWLGPLVSEATRTAKARVILSNPDGLLRPGLFVTARVAVASEPVAVRVPKTALQTIDDQVVVFIQDEDGFEPQPVQTGRESAEYVEITSGLTPAQRYVSKGAFTLKAQLGKGAFGDGHNH
jgi:cobalt-zinc-cadmium efflux system membrane fusion protein